MLRLNLVRKEELGVMCVLPNVVDERFVGGIVLYGVKYHTHIDRIVGMAGRTTKYYSYVEMLLVRAVRHGSRRRLATLYYFCRVDATNATVY